MLWLFVLISDLYSVLMSFAYPGALEELMTGAVSIGPAFMLIGAIVALIPLVMAVLTLTLKDSMNRWLNIILGLVITFIFFGSFIELLTTMPAAHIQLLSFAAFLAPALIVWLAWKWPKE